MSSQTYKDRDAALAREDALKVELCLALSRSWAEYQAPKMIREIAELRIEVATLKAELAGQQAAVSKLINDMRPEEQ